MSFVNLGKLESGATYLDRGIKQAKKKAALVKSQKFKGRIEKSRHIEVAKLETIAKYIQGELKNILISFPSIDSMTDFYRALVRSQIEYIDLKRSLGSLNWGITRLTAFLHLYKKKIFGLEDITEMNKARTQFLGRVGSLMKQLDKHLKFVDGARKIMEDFPSIKDMPTIALYGFPNVGKSTLLAKITSSSPEIKEYAFTTKKLNIGYITKGYTKIQVIDTPGTLDRAKMNPIEKQAELAIKYCADLVVFVIDAIESYPRKHQLALFAKIKKDHIVYITKTDLVADIKELEKKFENKEKIFQTPEALKDFILKTI